MDSPRAAQILKVGPDAGPDELKRAFRRRAKEVHPDRYRTFTERRWATRQFIRVREAYDVLRAAAARREAARSASRNSGGTPTAGPVPDLSRVTPWTRPGEVNVEIEVDPFLGWRMLTRVFFLPFLLLKDSKFGDWLGTRGLEVLLQPIVGLLVMIAFPGALGLAIVLIPVLLTHTLLLGGAALLNQRGKRGGGADADGLVAFLCRPGFFFLLELLIGGGLLALIGVEWFGRPDLTTEDTVVGLILWGTPAAFLLVEAANFAWTALLTSRVDG